MDDFPSEKSDLGSLSQESTTNEKYRLHHAVPPYSTDSYNTFPSTSQPAIKDVEIPEHDLTKPAPPPPFRLLGLRLRTILIILVGLVICLGALAGGLYYYFWNKWANECHGADHEGTNALTLTIARPGHTYQTYSLQGCYFDGFNNFGAHAGEPALNETVKEFDDSSNRINGFNNSMCAELCPGALYFGTTKKNVNTTLCRCGSEILATAALGCLAEWCREPCPYNQYGTPEICGGFGLITMYKTNP